MKKDSNSKNMKIGRFLLKKGVLNDNQVDEVLTEQNKAKNALRMRFGRIAVNKGYISEKELNVMMMEKYQSENDHQNKDQTKGPDNKQKKGNPYSFLNQE